MDAASQGQSLSFMASRLRSNPLVVRTLRQPGRLKWAGWIIALVSLVTFFGALFYKQSNFMNVLVVVGSLALIVNPIFAAMTAANYVAHAVKEDTYELLCLTTLPNAKLVEGHFFAALYRLRLPLVLVLGLSPSIIVRVVDFAYFDNYLCSAFGGTYCIPPTPERVLSWFAFACLMITASFVLLAFGIALGTALGLWWRNHYIASPVTAAIMISLLVGFFILLAIPTPPVGFPPDLIYAAPFTLVVLILAFGIAKAAQRVVRYAR